MPSKLPRRRNAGGLVPAGASAGFPTDPRAALILGGAHVAHGGIQAGGQIAGAAAQTLGHSIQSFERCFGAFLGYLREREITDRLIAQEREITARIIAQEREITARIVAQAEAATERVRLWSAAMIADAEARTSEVRTQARLVLAAIEDGQSRRASKLEVIQGFMKAYERWNAMLVQALASRADRMPLHEREILQQHIDRLLQRAREMEVAITSVAVTL